MGANGDLINYNRRRSTCASRTVGLQLIRVVIRVAGASRACQSRREQRSVGWLMSFDTVYQSLTNALEHLLCPIRRDLRIAYRCFERHLCNFVQGGCNMSWNIFKNILWNVNEFICIENIRFAQREEKISIEQTILFILLIYIYYPLHQKYTVILTLKY